MFSQKKQSKSVIKITDTNISYLTLKKNNQGFFVDQHDTIDIPTGIIERGEILKADIFSQITKKIQKNIDNKNVDILLPHDFFLFNETILPTQKKSMTLKKRIKEYFSNLSDTESWQKTHVCEFESFNIDQKESVLFTCLPKDIQKSYIHIFKKSGLNIHSINSDIIALGHVISEKNSSLIYLSDKNSRVIDFKKGMYVGHKTFQLSYRQFTEDIIKNITLSDDEALRILGKYGVLRTHKDPAVYKRLSRSMGPLLDYFKKRKSKNELTIYVAFEHMLVKGFADALSYSTRTKVNNFDIFSVDNITFQDVLQLHKKDSYHYQSHIAQALRFWKK